MAGCETFEANGKFDITRADDILYLEVREFGVEAEFLNDARVFAASKPRCIFRLGAGNDHLPRSKDQGGGLRVANAHNNGSETLGSQV